MDISKLCKRYGRNFVLCENKTLKDLEPYGFQPTYDTKTGELIKETLWLENGIYGNRPLLIIANRKMEQKLWLKSISLYKYVMSFCDWKYKDYWEHNRRIDTKLDIEIKQTDEVIFNVLIDLINGGIIKRKEAK